MHTAPRSAAKMVRKETMKIRKSVMALAIVVASWAAAERVLADDAEVLGEGKRVYGELCMPCHGFDGVKVMPEAPSFVNGESLEKGDEELLASIGNGKGDIMPPWAEELSQEEIVSVLTYVRTLGMKK